MFTPIGTYDYVAKASANGICSRLLRHRERLSAAPGFRRYR